MADCLSLHLRFLEFVRLGSPNRMERWLHWSSLAPYPGSLPRLSRSHVPAPSICLTRLSGDSPPPFLLTTGTPTLCQQTTLSLVSLTFILNLVGFLLAALSTVYLTDHLGFGKTITLGAGVQVLGYAFQCWAPPFPVFVASFGVSGFGESSCISCGGAETRGVEVLILWGGPLRVGR